MTAPASPHTATPTLAAVDPRGLALRTVGYCREHSDQAPAARIERCAHNAAGQRQASWDPRLWAQGSVANLRQVYGLSGRLLLNDSVDAGWSLQLLAESALPVLVWDARGTRRRLAYDERLRPVEIAETPAQGSEKVSERYEYAGADSGFAAHNQCGRLLRHDDPGGTLHLRGYALSAALCRQTRHFLQSLDAVDWPSAAAERDALLEPGAGFSSHEVHDAAGQLISRTDARGNQTLFRHTLDARPGPIALRLAGAGSATALLTRVTYDAWGQVEQQTAGNGVLSHYTRDPASGRLLRLQHGVPGLPALQDLHYRHDPRGNLVEIVDAAMPVRHFANQRIEPRCTYRYDSLYQLVEASGHEFVDAVPGPGLPPLQALPVALARAAPCWPRSATCRGWNCAATTPAANACRSCAAGWRRFCTGSRACRPGSPTTSSATRCATTWARTTWSWTSRPRYSPTRSTIPSAAPPGGPRRAAARHAANGVAMPPGKWMPAACTTTASATTRRGCSAGSARIRPARSTASTCTGWSATTR